MVRTILALVAIFITVSLFLAGRRRKRLSYSFSSTRVLGVHELVNAGRVQILFDGAPVTEVHLVIITVKNWGNDTIRTDDFERLLQFSCSEPARILSAEVAEVSPESLQPKIRVGVHEIVVDRLLLNPGDWFQIKTMINQFNKLSVDARIVGVKQITKAAASAKTPDTFIKMMVGIALVGSVMVLSLLLGEHLGGWKANGLFERRIFLIYFFGVMFFLVEQLKAATLDLVASFKNKDDSR